MRREPAEDVARLRAAIDLALSDHYETGIGGRTICGRCRYGDGIPMAWPCPTVSVLTKVGTG